MRPSSSKTKVSGSRSSLTTDMACSRIVGWTKARLRRARCEQRNKKKVGTLALCPPDTLQTTATGSRSLRYFQNPAGPGGRRPKPAFGSGNARLGGGGAAADIQDPALGSHHAGILGHAFDK